MADRREAILSRLLAVLKTVGIPGVTVLRNPTDLAEDKRPAILLFDGDESRSGGGPNQRGAQAAHIVMAMRPAVLVLDRKAHENVGTVVNGHRAAVIKAILSDTALSALTYNDTGVSYEGSATSLARGRAVEADVTLDLTITYLLKISDL